MMTATRLGTFGGFLGFGDYEIAVPGAGSSLVTIKVRSGSPAGACRSPRPFIVVSCPWRPEHAGLSAEDPARAFAAEIAPAEAGSAGLPGEAVEAWLLPVISFSREYLIVPAGDWPAR
jgi:hypothetical protein